VRPGKVNELFVYDNFSRVTVDEVQAGDICAVTGIQDIGVSCQGYLAACNSYSVFVPVLLMFLDCVEKGVLDVAAGGADGQASMMLQLVVQTGRPV
jgi:predicted membrane GTPase involved in stress response